MITGGLDVEELEVEDRRRGVMAETMSKTPKTLALNMARMRTGSESIAGASYTADCKSGVCLWTLREEGPTHAGVVE
jgi:hypothetical protein